MYLYCVQVERNNEDIISTDELLETRSLGEITVQLVT